MAQHIGRRPKRDQTVTGIGQVDQAQRGRLGQHVLRCLDERQVEALNLMAPRAQGLLQPFDDEPRAAVDERYEGGGQYEPHRPA